MILNEKVNIENSINIEFFDENKGDKNDFEKQKEIKINLPAGSDYFLDLRSKNLLWKVNPIFTYTIEKLTNIEQKNNDESQSNSDSDSLDKNKDNNEKEFYKSEHRSRSLRTNSPSSIRNDNFNENNENENEDYKKGSDNEVHNESFEKAGDSSDLSASSSDEKSDDSN